MENSSSYCEVYGKQGEGTIITADPNTNLINPKTLLPSVSYSIPVGESEFVTEIKVEIKEEIGMFENKPVITSGDIRNGMEFAVKQVRCNLEEF